MLFSARRLVLVLLCLILLVSIGAISPSYLIWRQTQLDKVAVDLPALYPVPVPKTYLGQVASFSAQTVDLTTPAQITAKSYAVIDLDTGTVLLEKNYRLPLPPASTVKMMTALVARGYISPAEILTVVTGDNADESRSVFAIGESYVMSDWLHALLLPSSNTAGRVLARSISDHGTDYLAAFAQHAALFGLTDSKFNNATGIDSLGQVMSARDETLLARQLMKDNQLSQIVALSQVDISTTPSGYKRTLKTTNELLTTDPSAKGIKTGTTPQAGEVLVSLFDKPPRKYLVVVMGSRDRYADTLNLLFQAQQNHELTTVNWQ